MKKIVIIDDYCPTLEETHSISVKYARVSMLGVEPAYKKTGFECSVASYNEGACPIAQQCPVFLKAKTVIN